MTARQRAEFVMRLRCAADDILMGRIRRGSVVNVGLALSPERWACVSVIACTKETAFELLDEAALVEAGESFWDATSRM